MSSKVYKSEKPKLKFAQSNINHVYRGNTAETQYKPAVRQYGMQVVGKLQGTRRLPPPAWVPSIKAESGGLDSRVALVPPGGSGWGAPTTSEASTTSSGTKTTEVGSVSVTNAIPSVNGTLTSEALSTSFEPAYARSHFGQSAVSTAASSVEPVVNKTFNAWKTPITESTVPAEHPETEKETADKSATDGPTAPPLWVSRTQASGASGGLAANKPFFQRPTPTTVSSGSASVVSKPETATNADEGVVESSGWAAISEEEPNYDEQIVFSDEEDTNDAKPASNTASSQQASVAPATPNFSHTSQPSHKPGSLNGRASAFASVSSNFYDNSVNRLSSDVWASSDRPTVSTVHPSHPLPHPSSVPFTGGQLFHGNTNSDERMLFGSHTYGHHVATSGQTTLPAFPDPFLTCRPNALADLMLPTGDIDAELQAQRQARTQEFKSAVERAQHARASRQMDTEGETMMQRSVVNIISGPRDTHTSATLNPSTSSNPLSSANLHNMQSLLGNTLGPQLLSTCQQGATPNRSDLAAAMAAATAVAMACNGAGVPPLRPGASTHLPNALHSVSHPTANPNPVGPWHGPFSSSSTTVSSGMFAVRQQTLPPVVQSTLAMASGATQATAPTPHQTPMYLDPDFVERVLEILNHQQIPLPSADQLSNRVNTPMETALSSTSETDLVEKAPPMNELDSKENHFLQKMVNVELDEQNPKGIVPTTSPSTQHSSCPFTASSDMKMSEQVVEKTEIKRIPGLMDVKVSSSRNFNLSWDEDNVGGRVRAKSYASDRSRGVGRGRRPAGRFQNDVNRSIRNRSRPNESNEGKPYGTPHEPYEDRTQSVRQRNWQSTKTHPQEPLTNGAKSSHDLPTVFVPEQKGHSKITDEHSRDVRRRHSNTAVVCDGLEDKAKQSKHKTDSAEIGTDDVNKNDHDASESKQHRKSLDLSDSNTLPINRSDYSHRGERARRTHVSTSYVSKSRAYESEDVMPRSSHMESKSYTRTSRGITFTRGHRASAYTSDSRGRRVFDDPRNRFADRPTRGSYVHSGRQQSTRTTRGTVYYDSEGREKVSNVDNQIRTDTPPADSRQPLKSHSGNHPRADHLSDGEQGDSDRRYSRLPRNRSHEETRKSSFENLTDGSCRKKSLVDDLTDKTQLLNLDPTNNPTASNDDEESDIPTVRVPATDLGYNTRSSYIHSRSNRSGTFPRGGGGPKRISSRLTSVQQTKRPHCSAVPSSHRYRDQRDRYRDDRDGDGGAAAGGGGAGSSTATGSYSTNNPVTDSTTSNCENMNGSQNSGGSRETEAGVDPLNGSKDSERANHNHLDGDNRSYNRRLRSGVSGSADTRSSGSRSHVSGQHSERSYVSASGTRSSTGQRFHRTYLNRYNNGYSEKHPNVATILPLMSIASYPPSSSSEAALSQTKTECKSGLPDDPRLATVSEEVETVETSVTVTKGHTSSDLCEEYSDENSLLSEGFTKVVSKASKRLARRRMQQQELSAGTKSSVKRSSTLTKTGQISDKKRDLPNSSSRPTSTGSTKSSLQKSKAPSVKTGISSVTHKPTNSLIKNNLTKTLESGLSKPWAGMSTQCSAPSNDTSQTIVSTVRPWSKVVGAKSSTPSAVPNDNQTPIANVTGYVTDVEWPVGPKDVDIADTHDDDILPNSIQSKQAQSNPKENPTTAVDGNFAAVRQFWAPDESNVQNELKSALEATVSDGIDVHTPISSNVVVTATAVSSTVSVSVSTISNNICKVKPQQQQQPLPPISSVNVNLLTNTVSLPTIAPISPSSHPAEQLPGGSVCIPEPTSIAERNESDFDLAASQTRSARRLPVENALLVTPQPTVPVSSSWGENVHSHFHTSYYPNRPGTLPLATGIDSSFPANLWPNDNMMDNYTTRMASSINQPFSHMHGSDVLSNIFTGPHTPSLCPEPAAKQHPSGTLISRSQSYSLQSYGSSVAPSGDMHNCGETNKLPPHSMQQSQTTAFPPMSGSMYAPPQQPSVGHQTQPAHAYHANWAIQSNAPRYRQKFAHQVEPPAFSGFSFQTDVQNEYAYGPGCVQPPATGGLFSGFHGQPQSGFHPHSSARHNMEPPNGNNPWSILGNPTVASNMQPSTQDFGAAFAHPNGGISSAPAGGGGLLPHPLQAAGYTHGSVPLPISTSPNSNYVAHHNYVGVIGGGRPNANDLSNVSARQQRVTQNVFAPHNIAHSPAAPNQTQFPVHSAFYPSLSPSHHQRLQHLQQLTGAQPRPNVHSLMNPATGLYAAAFGTAPPPNQPTPPPSLHSQSQQALGLHLHNQRPGQPTAPLASRNVGAVANHAGSPLLIPSAVGPSTLPGFGQPAPPNAFSGYTMKQVLPTL